MKHQKKFIGYFLVLSLLNFGTFKDIFAKSVVLPVSRIFDQGNTSLCWAYTFLSGLETMYLVQHPGETLELSRGYMQYLTIQERMKQKIENNKLDIIENGWFDDAVYLLTNFGIVQFNDYHDVLYPSYPQMVSTIFSEATPEEQLTKLTSVLPAFFAGPIPEKTQFKNESISAIEFAKQLLGAGRWVNYGISNDGTEYTTHTQTTPPNAEHIVHFISQNQMTEKIVASLSNGFPVMYATNTHTILLYGVDLDDDNNPTRFYMKDSFILTPEASMPWPVFWAFQNLNLISVYEENETATALNIKD